MGTYIEFYCGNQNRELKKIVDPILMHKFGWLAQKDYDDFYSMAADVVWKCEETYDSGMGKSFDNYLRPCILNKIKSRITAMNRAKRCGKDSFGNPLYDLSIDAPIGEDESVTIEDILPSDFDMDAALGLEELYDERVETYLSRLTKTQRRILEMRMEAMAASEIKKRLGLSDKQYDQQCEAFKSFDALYLLWGGKDKVTEEDVEMSTMTQTMENCKTDRISIASIIKKIDRHTIRFDHPLQRESEQWSPAMKGNLVSDILQGNELHPLIFAEQIINGVPIIWDLDGKQRCTNAYSFAKNGFKVSKNIRRWMIKYQTVQRDKDGRHILDENGFPTAVIREFDIRGKRFSDLPEELQDRFLDYSFNYDQYLNCSEEDIGYHIERYNDGKPMTASQKGVTKLGTQYAEIVKSISNMPFFKDMGGYKVSEFKNGTIHRVVIESVMAAYFLEDWKKEQDYLCKYLKDHADISDFENFEELVGRLERVVTEEVADLFNAKDSFLWFGLFARFVKTGEEDKRFVAFLAEFSRSLHKKKVNGTSFDALCVDRKTGKTRSTKDKYIVVPKMELLEKLMNEYLHIRSLDGIA